LSLITNTKHRTFSGGTTGTKGDHCIAESGGKPEVSHRPLRQNIEQVDGKGKFIQWKKAMERGSPERSFTGMDAGRRRRPSTWGGAGGEE
jgi:hypothetical protein